ncbi:protein kinase family protein [Aquibacillus sp. 3ASR75-11]|uniref:Protein kinase family protein n=1 Tax=Terrihalobacillus insolitus TaxID=2950438 RepID=A0A9X4AN41_9BACI|nr:protein kinase family protein [Terrihalobacillus insolitus]MDC3415100.1 protein kinase family protein [Terrihalobacillus insolitus]MDC3426097.1 protein kinase family protein [Terrihalobacillus insolitus]
MLLKPFKKKWYGRRYGDYKIEKMLGEGRFGICYLATTNQGAFVVIKRFKPHILKKNEQKNVCEAVMLSKLNHHAIPKLLGVINDKELYGFVLEYKLGPTAETMLFKQKYGFNKTEIFNIGSQLISIIKYLHGKGIVHRDLRIPNVLIHDGKVSLIDFGLARWGDHERYNFDQDFSYLGDFLLYLHYSTFKKQQRVSKPWYEELDLTNEQIHLYKRMLRLEDPYSNIHELERDFLIAFRANSDK